VGINAGADGIIEALESINKKIKFYGNTVNAPGE
jgi:hypothetical protein